MITKILFSVKNTYESVSVPKLIICERRVEENWFKESQDPMEFKTRKEAENFIKNYYQSQLAICKTLEKNNNPALTN